jgi:hypothetical protein
VGWTAGEMRIKNYFPSPADPCERLISGLEYCINIEEIEIDEEEILYSVSPLDTINFISFTSGLGKRFILSWNVSKF